MTRKPRENGWLNPDGNTHHIDTQRFRAFHSDTRKATCGVWLHEARRVRVDGVDCMTCIVRVAKRQRCVPRPVPGPHTPSWWTKGGDRHVRSTNDPWRAVCGASLRRASGSGNPPNCVACGGVPGRVSRTQSLRDLDGVRHEMPLDDLLREQRTPCGISLEEVGVVLKGPNCLACREATDEARRAREGKQRGRLPQHRR